MRLALATASAQDGSAPFATETRAGRNAKRSVIACWVVLLVLLLRHREVISSDTLSNYIHVWFVADSLWHGEGLLFYIPVRAHRGAIAFPYGFIPWMFAVRLTMCCPLLRSIRPGIVPVFNTATSLSCARPSRTS